MTTAQGGGEVGRSVHTGARVPTPRKTDKLSRRFKLILTVFLALTAAFLITSAASLTAAQTTTPKVGTEWHQSYAAGYSAHAMQQTADGGYVIAGNGSTQASGSTGTDMWLAKIDSSGGQQWAKTYGGTSSGPASAAAYSVHETSDGGFILAGWVDNSSGTPMPEIVKTYANGTLQWGGYYAYLAPGGANDVQQTNDGGYLVVGTQLNGTKTEGFVMTADSSGHVQATQVFAAGSTADKVQPTSDGGYVLVGSIGSSGSRQAYLVKLDESGREEWSQKYGGGGDAIGNAIVQADDGGYVFCGATNSQGNGGYDAWLVKTDANGNVQWQRTFGGTEDDSAISLQGTSDGGYILGGVTQSFGTIGQDNAWLVKTDANGNYAWDVLWYHIEGAAGSVLQANDGSYVISGSDAATGSPYVLQTTAETTLGPGTTATAGLNGMAIGVLVVLVGAVGTMGIWRMRRSKRAPSQLDLSAPSGGATTGVAGGATTGVAGGATTGVAGGATTGVAGLYRARPPSETRPSGQYGLASDSSFPVELGSQYSEARYLGEGGFARVFSALNLQRTPVAVKVLKTSDPKAGKLFATEAANWTVLRHENIVRLFDYNIFPVPYLESELCDGNVELEMLRGPVTVERSIEIVEEVARGLSYAHKLKILHGDIKPSNMLLKDNVVKVSDWGLSKLKTEQSVSIAGVTLQYAAPEELSRQFGRADERTDIYQLGVLFYQLVTGKLPFADEPTIVDAILQQVPVPPSQIRPVSPKLDSIILKCLRKRKEERYQSMDMLLTDLGGVSN